LFVIIGYFSEVPPLGWFVLMQQRFDFGQKSFHQMKPQLPKDKEDRQDKKPDSNFF